MIKFYKKVSPQFSKNPIAGLDFYNDNIFILSRDLVAVKVFSYKYLENKKRI